MKSISLAATTMLGIALLAGACGGGEPAPAPTPRPTATVVPAPGALPIPDPHELYVATADGAEMRLRSSEYISYSWGPNGEIAVVESRYTDPGLSSLTLIKPDGTADPIAEFDGYTSSDPLWSPDGDRLMLILDQMPGFQIVSVGLADGEVAELSDEGTNYPALLAWLTPEEVLVSRQTDEGGVLLWMDPATGETRPATDISVEINTYLSEAGLSSDQAKLLVVGADPSGNCESAGLGDAVYVIELATGVAKKVAQVESCSVASVAWSPDETAIAYTLFEQPDASGAFVVDRFSGQSRRISSGLDARLRWLDGDTLIAERLVCWQCGGGQPSLVMLQANGSGEDVLLERSPNSVSASGDRLAVTDAGGVRITELDGSASVSVAEAETRWDYGRVSWAPDDSHFAYVRSHGSNTNRVFEVDADGQNLETLVAAGVGPGSYGMRHYPSPGGSHLAIMGSDTPEVEKAASLWLADGDGSNEQQVEVASVGSVAWSLDGTKLAFTAEWKAPDGLSDVGLYIVNADGSDLINLEVGLNDRGLAPVWSPDSKNIAITEYDRQVLLVDISQSHAIDVDTSAIGDVGAISWAGNSQVLMMAGGYAPPNGGGSVALVDADGANFRVVPLNSRDIINVALSPDGSQIAYWKNTPGVQQSTLILADAATGAGIKIASTSPKYPGTEVAWSPDGTRFATTMILPTGSGIYIVDVDDLEMRQVTDGGHVTNLWWVSEDRLGFRTEIYGL